MRVVFFGTPLFAAEILKHLILEKVEIVAVVTRPDKPKGRSLLIAEPPVKEVAKKLLKVPIYQPVQAYSLEFVHSLQEHHADLFVVVAYGQILKQIVLDLPKKGCINVHASLLPKYRGAAPIQRAIIAGEKETGITVMQMSLGMDEGDILSQMSMKIPEDMNAAELQRALCELSKPLLVTTMHSIENDLITPIPQNSADATYAAKIELADAKIDWHQNAYELHNLIRGTNPMPGSWCILKIKGEPKKLKVLKTSPLQMENIQGSPGQILRYDKKGWVVACGQGALQLLNIQVEGKKTSHFDEFVNGYRLQDISFF